MEKTKEELADTKEQYEALKLKEEVRYCPFYILIPKSCISSKQENSIRLTNLEKWFQIIKETNDKIVDQHVEISSFVMKMRPFEMENFNLEKTCVELRNTISVSFIDHLDTFHMIVKIQKFQLIILKFKFSSIAAQKR